MNWVLCSVKSIRTKAGTLSAIFFLICFSHHFYRRPVINYPKPRTKARPPPGQFIPGGSKADSSDPRKATKRNVDVAVPRLKGATVKVEDQVNMEIDAGSSRFAPHIPRRKNAGEIKAELDEIQMRQRYYRPAHVKAVSSDSEKDRLAQICEYKGGKGLPSQVIVPAREAPFERAGRLKEEERMEKVRAKHRKSGPAVAPTPMSAAEELKMQISREVSERCDYLEEMKSMGALDPQKERAIKQEISFRVNELKRLEEKG